MPLEPREVARHFFDGDPPNPRWFAKISKKHSRGGWVRSDEYDEEVRVGGKKNTLVEARAGQVRLSYTLAADGSGVLQSYGHYPLAVRLRSSDVVLNDADHMPSMTTMRQWYAARGAAYAYAEKTGRSVTHAPLAELVQLATDIVPVPEVAQKHAGFERPGYERSDFPVGTKVCPGCGGQKRKRGEDFCHHCWGCGWVAVDASELRSLQTALWKTRRHRVILPHGGCATAGRCVEPVPAAEKCSAGRP